MRIIQYRIAAIAALVFTTGILAQKVDKKYTEEFKVNKDVVINVDTRHTDIEIENWNKNEVFIEAMIEIEGASDEKKQQIIKSWKFKALGNKNEIDISSKNHGLFVEHVNIPNGEDMFFVAPSLNNHYPEISVENLGILDSFEVVMPDVFEFPEAPVLPDYNFNFNFEMPAFDYEKYQKDENYMKEWQENMKKHLEKMQVEMNEKSILMKERTAQRREELKARQEERKKHYEHLKEERAAKMKELAVKRKEEAKMRKEVLQKRRKEMEKNRIIVKDILADREKIKIKRTIKIKAPKEAKFNMNVSYGSMSFPN